MSPEILEKVLHALKSRIALKLGAEGGEHVSKKKRERDSEKVDVYRGAGWQMAYFFRKTIHKHAVLLKHKEVTFEPFKKEESVAPPPSPGSSRSRRKRKAIEIQDDPDDEAVADAGPVAGSSTGGASRSNASTTTLQDEDAYIRVKDEEDDDGFLPPRPRTAKPLFLQEDEEEDEKPEGKPQLRISYSGFSIFGKTLVVIVEPYPALRERASVAPSDRELSSDPRGRSESAIPASPDRDRSRSRSTSTLAPLRSSKNPLFRAETPLEEDDGQAEEDLDRFRLRSQSVLGRDASEDVDEA